MTKADAGSRGKWADRGISAFILLAMILILSLRFDFYYDLNDDLAMKDILSGVYTGVPDGHNIQMLYPLGWLISRFYLWMPSIPWYGLFLCGCQFGACGLCLPGILRRIGSFKGKCLGAAGIAAAAAGIFFYEWIFIQYTVTAGLLMTAAALRVLTGPSAAGAEFWRFHSLTALAAVLAFLLRSEMMLLFCPFLGLAVFYRIGNLYAGKKEGRMEAVGRVFRRYGGLLCVVGVFMLLAASADYIAYKSPDWKEFRRFFDDRTRVYDFYGIPSYEENREFYHSIGLKASECALLENYNFDLDQRINADSMEKIARYAAAHRPAGTGKQLYLSVYTYVYRFLHGQELFFDILCLFSYFFLFRAFWKRRDGWLLCKTALLFLLRSGLWIFLLYRGRAPERITHPLYLAELVFLFVLLFQDAGLLQWKYFEKWAILILYSVFFLCVLVTNLADVSERYAQREQKNREWRAWKDYAASAPERFYYLDVYSTVAYSEKLFADTRGDYRNFDLAGGWCVKSPLAYEKRIRGGVSREAAADGLRALLEENVSFVADHTSDARDPGFLVSLYKDRMDKDILIREAGRIENFTVYQIAVEKE